MHVVTSQQRNSARLITTGLTMLLLGVAPNALRAAPADPDPAKAPAGHYDLDPRHTSVTVKISHFGLSMFTARFAKVQGAYDFDPARPEASHVTVTIDPKSIDTRVPELDAELIGPKFFDSGKYPEIRFVATSVARESGDHGKLTGNLTYYGQTHPVTLDVIFRGSAAVSGGKMIKMGFSATGSITRSAFGQDVFKGILGDDVQLFIETEFIKS